ncbi:MAG: hypothetical protein ACI810_002551 [Gammaproteobacteria bacterium]
MPTWNGEQARIVLLIESALLYQNSIVFDQYKRYALR